MRSSAFSTRLRSPRAVVVPTALALGIALAPIAGPHTALPQAKADPSPADLSSNFNPGISDYIAPSAPPQRTPTNTEHPDVPGLPDGVDIDRVEYLSPRHLMVYIKSQAMPDKLQKVQMLLARDYYENPDKTFPEVWALDGLRARDDESGWTIETNIESFYADKNVNVVMPVGGESSFYSDWKEEDNGQHYMWETFLTKELIPIMQKQFRSNDKRAVVGISMGGTAAVNLAERNPHLFDFVGSFSGYLDTTTTGMPEAITAAQIDAGNFDSQKMWGPLYSQDWIDHDPKLGTENLKDMTVYVSSGSGRDDFGQKDSVAKGPANLAGIGLEVISRMSTQTFERYSRNEGVKTVAKYRPSGVHSWEYWQFEMTQAFPYIADSFGLSKEDRGADCHAIGAIAEATKGGSIGSCVNNEYDIADGKQQNFRAGTAYWSPHSGAHALYGAIDAKYAQIGGPDSWLGFPKSTENKTPDGDGRFVDFENGSIYWTAKTGAFAVPNDIKDEWGKEKWEAGKYGYPVAEPVGEGDGLYQEFQGGVITRNPDKSHQQVFGLIGQKYRKEGGAKSALGFPTSSEQTLKDGWVQHFEHGHIYARKNGETHVVLDGGIFDAWGKKNFENGVYGWPTEDTKEIPAGGREQKFEHGTIREVNGKVQESKS